MNYWTELSREYANQRAYLDDLFHVYPTIPDGIREINTERWANIEIAFNNQYNEALIKEFLKLELFPIKDSYVAYLKRDATSILRNPKTINRICGRIYEMGLDKIFERCSEPKETNKQIGPFFRPWTKSKALGIQPVSLDEFISSKNDAILNGSDKQLMDFASSELNYKHPKGLDFIGRFNGKYVIDEAKFLTDFGGHQNAQFNDAISTVESKDVKAIKITILDGVLYIKGNNKMYKDITAKYKKLINYHFSDEENNPQFQKFNKLKSIVQEWYNEKVLLLNIADPRYKRLLYFEEPKKMVDHIARGINPQLNTTEFIRPVFNYYNKFSSTKYVNGNTVKEVYPTQKSHINYVVMDSDWEGISAKTLEEIETVECYVKNQFLGFAIPYTKDGKDKQYFTDFIARVKSKDGTIKNLMIEISGMNKDKAEKKWFVENRWIPAVNALKDKYEYPEWHFIEVANDIRNIKNQLIEKIQSI